MGRRNKNRISDGTDPISSGAMIGDSIASQIHRYNNDVEYRINTKSDALDAKKYKDENIPFIEDKAVKLTNAGRATGAVLSTNMLDSIAKYSDITDLPLKRAIGLATKESTLGNPTSDLSRWGIASKQTINKGYDINPEHLVSYWKYRERNPFRRLISSIRDRIQANRIARSDRRKYLRWEENSADKQARDYEKYNTGPVLKAAFSYYRDYPERYNPGQKNYRQMVDTVGDEVWGSPEIQKWYKRRLESAGKMSK